MSYSGAPAVWDWGPEVDFTQQTKQEGTGVSMLPIRAHQFQVTVMSPVLSRQQWTQILRKSYCLKTPCLVSDCFEVAGRYAEKGEWQAQ